jgi:hypothetical protein
MCIAIPSLVPCGAENGEEHGEEHGPARVDSPARLEWRLYRWNELFAPFRDHNLQDLV